MRDRTWLEFPGRTAFLLVLGQAQGRRQRDPAQGITGIAREGTVLGADTGQAEAVVPPHISQDHHPEVRSRRQVSGNPGPVLGAVPSPFRSTPQIHGKAELAILSQAALNELVGQFTRQVARGIDLAAPTVEAPVADQVQAVADQVGQLSAPYKAHLDARGTLAPCTSENASSG